MATIAIRKDVRDGLSTEDWNHVRTLPDALMLGTGPLQTDGVNQWYVYDDNRLTLNDIARIASVLGAGLTDLLSGDLSAWFTAIRWTVPADAGDQDDPFAYTLEQNGGTDLMLAGSSLPQLHDPEE